MSMSDGINETVKNIEPGVLDEKGRDHEICE